VEWAAHRSEELSVYLRSGYFYEPSPAPRQTAETNYVDADKHGVSLGLGLALVDPSKTLGGPFEIGLTVQSVFLPTRTTEKTDPADPVGDYTARGYSMGGFVTMGVQF